MLGLFTKRLNEKVAIILVKNLYEQLKDAFPDLYENAQHWQIRKVIIRDNNIYISNISYDEAYVKKNEKRHNRHYQLTGIRVHTKKGKNSLPLSTSIQSNNLHSITINTNNLYKTIDPGKIDISGLSIEEIFYKNHDRETLVNIIGELAADKAALLEIDDTFEIDLGNRKLYTILDMEDGNYIAVDRKGQVFRLNHDASPVTQKISENVTTFLQTYNGNKGSLADLFAD